MQLKEKRKQAKREGRDTIEEDDPEKVCEWRMGGGRRGRGGRRVVCAIFPHHVTTLSFTLHTITPLHLHTLTQYSQALRTATAKLFADLEIKKKHLEDRDQSER